MLIAVGRVDVSSLVVCAEGMCNCATSCMCKVRWYRQGVRWGGYVAQKLAEVLGKELVDWAMDSYASLDDDSVNVQIKAPSRSLSVAGCEGQLVWLHSSRRKSRIHILSSTMTTIVLSQWLGLPDIPQFSKAGTLNRGPKHARTGFAADSSNVDPDLPTEMHRWTTACESNTN